MLDPLLDGLATERYQRLLREADHWRLMKTVTRQQPRRRSRVLVTLAGWLIQGGNYCTPGGSDYTTATSRQHPKWVASAHIAAPGASAITGDATRGWEIWLELNQLRRRRQAGA